MAFRDLREFIDFLEDRGDLRRITEPVSRDLEITEITDRTIKSGGPALLFENIEGYRMPLAINFYGTHQRMAWALGVDDVDEITQRVRKLLGMIQGPPGGYCSEAQSARRPRGRRTLAAQARQECPVPGGHHNRQRR